MTAAVQDAGLSLSARSDKNHIVNDTPVSKIARIREELNRMFLERVDLIDGAIVAMLSANHVLIIVSSAFRIDEFALKISSRNAICASGSLCAVTRR